MGRAHKALRQHGGVLRAAAVKYLIAALFCWALLAPQPGFAGAASERVTGTLALEPRYGDRGIDGCTFELYRVADVTFEAEAAAYTLLEAFQASGVDLNMPGSAEEQNAKARELIKYIAGADPAEVIATGTDGSNIFTELEAGAYLVVQRHAPTGYTPAGEFLVFVPTRTPQGWSYAVKAFPKLDSTSSESGESDGAGSLTVLKRWEDYGAEAARPGSVRVALYNGETLYTTVSLSEENSWRHTWRALPEGDWSVEETEPPEGYQAIIDREGDVVTITNVKTSTPLSGALSVTKLWEGDTQEQRPDSIELTLYRDGEAWETVTLTANDGWSRSWAGLDTAHAWTVRESSAHEGYVSSVEALESGGYIIRNSYAPPADLEPNGDSALVAEGEPVGGNAPQTGQLRWPVPVLLLLGALLIAAGICLLRRKKHE